MDISTLTVPLRQAEHGVVLVGSTRVPLDTVIYWYNQGESAEYLVQHFPTLQLADVYAVIAYYLQHREAVDAYMRESEQTNAAIRAEADANSKLPKDYAMVLKARLTTR